MDPEVTPTAEWSGGHDSDKTAVQRFVSEIDDIQYGLRKGPCITGSSTLGPLNLAEFPPFRPR